MDQTTMAVREMYERFPYPSGPPTFRAGTDARLLLSRVARGRAHKGPIHVLDAGCGRGLGTLACATLQPDVQFVGVDINRVALAEARAQAKARKLDNVDFQEHDLMTLKDLQTPAGGFDVILSSGVLHHLSDPAQGLERLREVLAPHGVISMMLYGGPARAPLQRLIGAATQLLGHIPQIDDKLADVRRLAQAMAGGVLAGSGWEDTAEVDDVELVDRVLNANERSYSLAELWSLLEGAGLRFVDWSAPEDWALDALALPDELATHAKQLGARDRFQLVECTAHRPKLEFTCTHRDNGPRPALTEQQVESTLLSVNPEACFIRRHRNLHGFERTVELSLQVRSQDPTPIGQPVWVKAFQLLEHQSLPFSGDSMVAALSDQGVGRQDARQVLCALVAQDVLYRPHGTEVG